VDNRPFRKTSYAYQLGVLAIATGQPLDVLMDAPSLMVLGLLTAYNEKIKAEEKAARRGKKSR
jgi:hypothetical protein